MSIISQKDILPSNNYFYKDFNVDEFEIARQVYNAGIKQIKAKLEVLDEEFRIKYDYNPIHHIESRLKTQTSVIRKLFKQGNPISVKSMKDNLHDVAGVRVICNYTSDIYQIAKLLQKQDDIKTIEIKDYIKKPKPSGYRSYHFVVQVPVYLAENTVLVDVEIQIRTIGMDLWASLEHNLSYKSEVPVTKDIMDRLKECAIKVNELDDEMEAIHTKINRKALRK